MTWLSFLQAPTKGLDAFTLMTEVEIEPFQTYSWQYLLFFFYLNFLIGCFSTLGRVKRSLFLSLNLEFFNPRVFYRAAWGTSFGNNSNGWLKIIRTMLEVSGPVQDGLRLVLRISPKLTIDTVCKGSIFSKICPEKTLKFCPSNWNFFRRAMFMLMPLLDPYTTKKWSGKKDTIGLIRSGSFKVVFILLTKAVTVQVRIPIIEVGEPAFQWLLSKLYLD